MIELPQPETFYSNRDDRTNRVSDSTDYRNAAILIAGERDVLESYAGRVAARTVLNLLSRFTRDVDLAFPSVAPDDELPPVAPTLAEQSIRQMWSADPHGRFGWTQSPTVASYDCVVTIGNPSLNVGSVPTVRLDGGGWLARISRGEYVEPLSNHGENPIGPAVAACLGGAEVFKTVVGMAESSYTHDITYDAFLHEVHEGTVSADHPTLPSAIDVGTARMIGVGSVGSTVAYFLRRLPIEGTLQLVDHDPIKLVNLNRSPLFTASQAISNTPKVEAAAEFLEGHVDVQPFVGDYDEFTSSGPTRPDVVFPLANERNVRRSIQYDRPPLMIHASTGQSDVFLRRNIPLKEPCLLCHFPPDTAEVNAACAQGETPTPDDTEENRPDAAFPFASYLAGCLVAAEIAKVPIDGYPFVDEPITFIQTLTALGRFSEVMQYPPSRTDDCPFCRNEFPDVHREMINGTRFVHLTE